MRLSKFGYANKKTAKNYKSYSALPKYFYEDDRIRYINLEIGIDILTVIEKETGRKYIGENVLEEINAMNNTIKEIAAYQKRKENIAANRLLMIPLEAVLFLHKEGMIGRPTYYDFEIRRKIMNIKRFLEKYEKSLKRWIWNHIKVVEDQEP